MDKQECKIGMIIKVTYPGGQPTLSKIVTVLLKNLLFSVFPLNKWRYFFLEIFIN